MKEKNIGTSFDSWLREEGIEEEVTGGAIERVSEREMKAALDEALEESRCGEGRPAKEVFDELRAQYRIPR